jgi:hypothetical protein
MPNEKFKRAIFEALTIEYENLIPQTDEHIFSADFDKKMAKLIKRREKPYYKMINTLGKRIACFIIIFIIASCSAVMSVSALRSAFIDFWVNIFDKFSIVRSVNNGNAPETIEKIYEITYDLSDYSYDLWFADEYTRKIEYAKEDVYINFEQSTKSVFDTHLNTEDSVIETVIINGSEAVYFTDNHNYHTIIWDNGDYVFLLRSNISKTELINIANSVQKVE